MTCERRVTLGIGGSADGDDDAVGVVGAIGVGLAGRVVFGSGCVIGGSVEHSVELFEHRLEPPHPRRHLLAAAAAALNRLPPSPEPGRRSDDEGGHPSEQRLRRAFRRRREREKEEGGGSPPSFLPSERERGRTNVTGTWFAHFNRFTGCQRSGQRGSSPNI